MSIKWGKTGVALGWLAGVVAAVGSNHRVYLRGQKRWNRRNCLSVSFRYCMVDKV